jgi:ribosomal-protein-alanine N-acetyltransferase
MRPENIAGVIALAAGEPTAPHWPAAEYHRMLDVIAASPARRGAWVLLLDAHRPAGARRLLGGSRAANRDGNIAGFSMASHVSGICDLEAVVVDAAWRGRGYGQVLVEAAAAWGDGLGASRLELEVRASNTAALRLYRRMGFATDGVRPGYYRNPEEEAVLMSLDLSSPGPGRIA